MMKKISPRTAMMVVVAALVVYAIYTQTIGKTSAYAVTPKDYAPVGVDLAPSSPDSAPLVSDPSCEMKAGSLYYHFTSKEITIIEVLNPRNKNGSSRV